MNKHLFKRTAAFIVASAMLVTSFLMSPGVSVYAAENEGQAAAVTVKAVGVEDILSSPDMLVTRGQFALLINTFFGFALNEGAAEQFENFKDVPKGHPYEAELLCAKVAGYMVGTGSGNVNPDAVLTGAEAAVIVNNLLGFDASLVDVNDALVVPSWAKPSASVLADLNMITGEAAAKGKLTSMDALTFLNALAVATQFYGSPYALTQSSLEDDFYAYTNRQYLATKEIAPGYMFAASFADTDLTVTAQTTAILEETLSTGGEKGSDEWKIKELYNMHLDNETRTKSIEKLKPYFDEINAAKNVAELLAVAKKYDKYFTLVPFYGVAPVGDAKEDASKYCVILVPSPLDLGSRDYYADSEDLAPIQEAYRDYITKVLAYIGETKDLEKRAAAIYEFEKARAEKELPQESYSDPQILYKETTWDEVLEATKTTGALTYSPEVLDILKKFNIYCPNMEYIKFVESFYKEENLQALKDFALISVVSEVGGMLGDDLRYLADNLRLVMFGQVSEKQAPELMAQNFVSSLMSEAFSRMYYKKYGSAEIKKDVTEIIESIRAKYRERITGVEWMSEATKKAAIEKLDAIKAYVAFPDEDIEATAFDVKAIADGGNLIDVFFSGADAAYDAIIDALQKPVDANFWKSVPTSTVNAYYSPTNNSIVIPLGILQEPFYNKDADREQNLGAIGAVIAHEFTHAFDSSGAQYDKNGTLTNWWAEDDYASFYALTEKVSSELSAIEFMTGATVNGALCTAETIADLGAMACVLDIADDSKDGDLAAVMESWSNIWASRMSPEVAAYFLSMDSHAPNKVRVNFILSQLGDFYDVYKVTETDGMYIPENKRISIW